MNVLVSVLQKILSKGFLILMLMIIFSAPFMVFWPMVIWPDYALDFIYVAGSIVTCLVLVSFNYLMFLHH